MKKTYNIYLISFLILIFVTACNGNTENKNSNEKINSGENTNTSENNTDEINLRLNSDTTAEDDHTRAFITPWIEEVEKKTEGLITIDAFFGEELLPLGEEVRALESKRIDIAAALYPSYDPGQFPLSDVTMLPLKFSDSLIASRAFADLISSNEEIGEGKTFAEYEYGQYDLKVFPIQPTPEYTIGLVKHELGTKESLEKLQIRTGGRAHEMFVEELGSQPVSMPYSEEFEALSRGVIDGNIRSFLDYSPFGFDELITNALIGMNLGHFPMIWAMHKEEWDKLPDDVQTIMEEVAFELARESTVKLDTQEEAIENAKNIGIEFTDIKELDQEAQEFIEQASVNTWESWIEANEEKGLPGLKLAKLWRDLIIENGGEVYEGVMNIE